ncbi:MAG: AAA family ATPase, partial [Candidatus Geothermincolia bacterium]
ADFDESLDDFRFEISCRVDSEGLRVVDEALYRLSSTLVGTKWKQEPALYNVVERSKRVGSELLLSYNNFAKGRRPRVAVSNLQPALTQKWHGPRMSDHADHWLSEATDAVTAALQQVFFLDPAPRLMRGYAFPEELRLKEDGANLSAVLFDLCENQKKKDVILEFIGALPERDVIDIDFVRTPRSEVMVQLSETFGGVERPCDAALLSDGTLRVLAVAAAVLSVPEGSTVIVEEVDNGVHPSRAQRLLQNINEVASKRRLNVVVTTHNPALLDALPAAAIPFVQYCYRDPDDGCSQVVQLDALARYPELIARDRLGALVTKGLLERMVTSNGEADAERRKTGIDWVRELRRGAKP